MTTIKINMKHIQYFLMIGCAVVAAACAPDDDQTLGELMSPADLDYTVSQHPDDPNKIILTSETPGIIPFWDYEIGISNLDVDTVDIPFKGDFWVKYRAMGQGGSVVDSTMITVPVFDPDFFSDPAWQLLTNGEDGKTWKLVAVRAGDAKSTTYSDWGDASWVSQNVHFNDSVKFDLDKGFNFTRYTSGVPSKATFGLIFDEELTGYLAGRPADALVVLQGGDMPSSDASEQMPPDNDNHYRIYKLSNDTLVLGQGAYYIPGNENDGWSYFHWYIRQ
jgi:hypothetical protein